MSSSQDREPLDWHEARRLEAWNLHQQGLSQHKIAQQLGVTQGAISQWLKRVQDGNGLDALRRHPAPGRQSALTSEQLHQLPNLIALGAKKYGFETNEWTTVRVAALLEQQYGVAYHPSHVSRLLRKYCPEWRTLKTKKSE